MKRFEFNDVYGNNIRVHTSYDTSDKNTLWLFVDGKTYENNEPKSVTGAACLSANQARALIASLQDMIDNLERKR